MLTDSDASAPSLDPVAGAIDKGGKVRFEPEGRPELLRK